LNLGNGIANINVETGALVTNGIAESNLDLAGNLSFGSATLTANLGNIIQSSGLISSTGNLNLNTNGGNAIINNSDVISLSGNTNGGNLTYADTDGVILGSLSTGAGDLIVSTGSGSLADNFINENNLSVLGPLSSGNITLSSLIIGADLNLNASTMQAINSLILNSNGNINGNSLINFPQLIAPNVQITATGLIGSSNSPIGIQTAGLLPTSFIDDQGRGAFLNQMSILNLSQDISSFFNLYPIYIIPSSSSTNSLMINTIAMEQSVYNSEHKFNHSLRRKEGLYGTRIHIVDETYIQKPYSILFNDSWAAFEGMREIKEN
jgi:hypothetical protein